MSEQARPWWASDGPVDGGIDPDEDPVERIRAARRGADGPPTGGGPRAWAEEGDEPWLGAVAATMSRLAEGTDHSPDVCGVCPICVGLRALAETRPELLGHLAEAARHVALAARSLRERPEPGADAEPPLEHIDLE